MDRLQFFMQAVLQKLQKGLLLRKKDFTNIC